MTTTTEPAVLLIVGATGGTDSALAAAKGGIAALAISVEG